MTIDRLKLDRALQCRRIHHSYSHPRVRLVRMILAAAQISLWISADLHTRPAHMALVGGPYTWPANFLGYEAPCLGPLKDT